MTAKAQTVAYREDRSPSAPEVSQEQPAVKAEAVPQTGDGPSVQEVGRSPANTGAPADGPTPKKKSGKAKRIVLGLLVAGLAFGAYEGFGWWTHGRFVESTDDAYVNADITTVLSKVSGHVASIEVRDNQQVRAGDVLLRLDDGDYRLAVRAAGDGIASAEATVKRIGQQIGAARASVVQAEASVASAEAKRDIANADYARQQKLVETHVASQQALEAAEADRKSAVADLASAEAAVEVARANIDVLSGQRGEAEQAVQGARTALAKAEYDLGFTIIRAPVDGIVSNRAAQIGTLLQAGSRVAALVPLSAVHIDANYKETQLGDIRPGAHVTVSVDAYPDVEIEGEVESISPATGSVFSLLPSENATGNFTKVVQRVPVRITVPAAEVANGHLRAGMSVVVGIDTRTGNAGDAVHADAR